MFSERKRIDGFSRSWRYEMFLFRKSENATNAAFARKLGFLALGLSLNIGPAFSANLTPSPCSLTSFSNPGGGLTPDQVAAVNAASLAKFGSDPANKYLSNVANTVTGSTATATAGVGTSLSGTEASTSLVSELTAQRRVQEALVCPAGLVKIDGVCQASRKPASLERISSSRSKSSSMTSLVGSTPAAPASREVRQENLQFQPRPVALSDNAVWAEGFYDFEKRTGLGTALSPASRTQETSGALFGADHTFRVGDAQLIVGALGSVSKTTQTFSPTSSDAFQNTTFSVDLSQIKFSNYPAPGASTSVYDYTFPVDHSLTTQEQQTLSGAGGGLTASISRGGFFSDGMFKFDFLNLNRTSVTSDTHATQLNINAVQNGGSGTNLGCIAVANPDGTLIANPYTLLNQQTSFSTSIQSTTAANFVIADSIGYHFDLRNGFWLEPLVGGAYTYSTYGSNAAALGLQDGQDVRLQAGGRFGLTSLVSNGGIWTTSLTELVYSDVLIRGFVTNADGFSAGYLLADQGKVRLQSILTSKLALRNGLSLYLECQGRVGNDYYAYGGRLGARLEF